MDNILAFWKAQVRSGVNINTNIHERERMFTKLQLSTTRVPTSNLTSTFSAVEIGIDSFLVAYITSGTMLQNITIRKGVRKVGGSKEGSGFGWIRNARCSKS